MNEYRLKYTIIFIALIGVALSSYITYYENFILTKNQEGICDINDTFNCSNVYKSEYAKIMGINISILGIIFYVSVIILSTNRKYVELLFVLSALGFLYSLYLTFYVELIILKVFCIFCLTSALLSTLIFILSLMLRKRIIKE